MSLAHYGQGSSQLPEADAIILNLKADAIIYFHSETLVSKKDIIIRISTADFLLNHLCDVGSSSVIMPRH